MLWKPNLIFVTSVTLNIKVTVPKSTHPKEARGEIYVPSFELIDVKSFEISHGNWSLWTDKQP